MQVCLHDVMTTRNARLVELDPRGLALFTREIALTELQNAAGFKEFHEQINRYVNDFYGTPEHHFVVKIFDHELDEEVENLDAHYSEAHITLVVDAISNGFHSFGVH